jgi:hypothetical protein
MTRSMTQFYVAKHFPTTPLSEIELKVIDEYEVLLAKFVRDLKRGALYFKDSPKNILIVLESVWPDILLSTRGLRIGTDILLSAMLTDVHPKYWKVGGFCHEPSLPYLTDEGLEKLSESDKFIVVGSKQKEDDSLPESVSARRLDFLNTETVEVTSAHFAVYEKKTGAKATADDMAVMARICCAQSLGLMFLHKFIPSEIISDKEFLSSLT